MKEKINQKIEIKRKKRDKFLRRGERILTILEFLTHGSAATYTIMAAFAPGTTYAMARNINGRHERINRFFQEEKEKQKFYNLLSYLQRNGLVAKEVKDKGVSWKITDKGKDKKWRLTYQLTHAEKRITLPVVDYSLEKTDQLIVIVFDIPEKDKLKRNWFRDVIKNLQFSPVQKSVWIGQTKIPKELIRELKKLNLLSCVKFFSVVEIGNLD